MRAFRSMRWLLCCRSKPFSSWEHSRLSRRGLYRYSHIYPWLDCSRGDPYAWRYVQIHYLAPYISISCHFNIAWSYSTVAAFAVDCNILTPWCPRTFFSSHTLIATDLLISSFAWNEARVTNLFNSQKKLSPYLAFITVGIDKFGCGNWKNVADYISSKNIKQVEEHYWEVNIRIIIYGFVQFN